MNVVLDAGALIATIGIARLYTSDPEDISALLEARRIPAQIVRI